MTVHFNHCVCTVHVVYKDDLLSVHAYCCPAGSTCRQSVQTEGEDTKLSIPLFVLLIIDFYDKQIFDWELVWKIAVCFWILGDMTTKTQPWVRFPGLLNFHHTLLNFRSLKWNCKCKVSVEGTGMGEVGGSRLSTIGGTPAERRQEILETTLQAVKRCQVYKSWWRTSMFNQGTFLGEVWGETRVGHRGQWWGAGLAHQVSKLRGKAFNVFFADWN